MGRKKHIAVHSSCRHIWKVCRNQLSFSSALYIRGQGCTSIVTTALSHTMSVVQAKRRDAVYEARKATLYSPSAWYHQEHYHLLPEPPPGELYPIICQGSAGSKRQKWNTQNVRITDLRTTDNHFDLHRNGFQFIKYPGTEGLKYEAFSDEANIKTKIYDEVKDLLRTAYATTHDTTPTRS